MLVLAQRGEEQRRRQRIVLDDKDVRPFIRRRHRAFGPDAPASVLADAVPPTRLGGVHGLVRLPDELPSAAALSASAHRVQVLAELIPALRSAAAARGALTASELAHFSERDLARGRCSVAPVRGVVQGIDASGRLLVETGEGVSAVRSGSLALEGEPPLTH